jgi:hypothetical protein
MAITKKQIIDTITAMPEEEFADIDISFERMIMLEKIERAEKNILTGKTYTTEDAKEHLAKWLH